MRIGKPKGTTFMLVFGSMLLRYLLLAVPIVVAIKVDGFNLVAAILGVFMVQLVLVADHLYRFVKPS